MPIRYLLSCWKGLAVKRYFAFGLIFVLLLPSIASFLPARSVEPSRTTNKAWTVMLYFCADTRNSEVVGIDNSGNSVALQLSFVKNYLKDDLAAGSDADLNVLMLFDYPYSPSDPNGHAVLYHITPGVETALAQWGPTNMGAEATLDQFVQYCKTNYPANNYALFLADHGRGYAGICYDYHAPHPYNQYALGDCLELPEIRGALSGGNEVDVLFLNLCLGSSFEIAWEVASVADYMMAGESSGPTEVVYHPRDVLYALSRDTSMTPRELAETGYQAAITPVLVPSGFDHWGSSVLLDLHNLSMLSVGPPAFRQVFASFTQKLIDEFTYNSSFGDFLLEVRANCTVWGLDSESSMMVDLVDFLEQVIAFQDGFYYTETTDLAADLIDWLTPGENNIIIGEWYWFEDFTHLHGLSICLPDQQDMYKGFLWPNMYQNLKISQDTLWGAVLAELFPTYTIGEMRIPECYNIFLHPLDPVTQLHIYFENIRDELLHVGLNSEFANQPGMGVELGLYGAAYHSDLLWGNAMVSIPATSLQTLASGRNGAATFDIVVNASATTPSPKTVNVTVQHVDQGEVVWEENQHALVPPGSVVRCQVSTNDSMTTFEVESPPSTATPMEIALFLGLSIGILFVFVVIAMVIHRRKNNPRTT